jgi:hypothetical protein
VTIPKHKCIVGVLGKENSIGKGLCYGLPQFRAVMDIEFVGYNSLQVLVSRHKIKGLSGPRVASFIKRMLDEE